MNAAMVNKTTTREKLAGHFKSLLCIFLSVVLATGLAPFAPLAYAADADKPQSVMLQIGDDKSEIDVTKNVATLDKQKVDTELYFTINDAYTNLSSNIKRREFNLVDSSGKTVETVYSDNGNGGHFKIGKLKEGYKLVLVTTTREANSTTFVKRYEQQLNVRLADTKKAETGTSTGSDAASGISSDGSNWSFSNGLQYTFKNTGFKFLEGTTMNLGALRLPLQYKHEADGTTIVGINANPEDKAFYEAVKNGNVWQKYSTEKMAEMTQKMDRGWSGKEFGSWGGKKFDWTVCGYMEFNTNKPEAPRAVNLIISMGMKAEGHAQYLCFTGTLTFTIGGKAVLTGKLIPIGGKIEGKFNLGAYAGLELYIGIGLNYVASVGGYGKGQIDIDFQMLPDTQLESIKLSGELGAKAKLFGFTIYTWKILEGTKPLYTRDAKKKAKTEQKEGGNASSLNADGTATSPFTVSADTPYPVDSRNYLNASSTLAAGKIETQEAQASNTILKGIYGETEMAGTTTEDGPIVVYVADAEQVNGAGSRDSYNRSVLVYSRQNSDGSWTEPAIIDKTSDKKDFADYSPTVTTDGENCYVTWLAADSKIADGATIGQVGAKLDVNVATISKNGAVTVKTVCEESNVDGSMPAGAKAIKVGDSLYVGYYTNQTTGASGEVIGLNGSHNVRIYKQNGDSWEKVSDVATENGAITSFDVGNYGGTAACAWSLNTKLKSESAEVALNGVNSLEGSTVYALAAESAKPVKIASTATNAQFAKRNNANVLTYALRVEQGDNPPYLSIMGSPTVGLVGDVVLNGAEVNLPTPYYKIAGDVGVGRGGNVSFVVLNNGSSDIESLVSMGAGYNQWSSIVETTVEQDVVTDYCSMYSNGLPLFIYTTEPVANYRGEGLSTQADNGAALNQTTEDSLRHLSVDDANYDEYAVNSGGSMPITVHYSNDGMLDVPGVDLWMLENDTATKVASSDETVSLNEGGKIEFNYTMPPKDSFTKAHELAIYAAPKGATVTKTTIDHALQTESAMKLSLGASSLALEADQQLTDNQESIAATVTNDGIVPQGAKMLFINGDTGETLATVEVPELQEDGTFNYTYVAPHGYFQNDGVSNIIVTLEDDGSEDEGYDINNTEFIDTWEVVESPTSPTAEKPAVQASQPASQASQSATQASQSAVKASAPKTGDSFDPMVVLALLAIAVLAGAAIAYSVKRHRE